MQMVESVFIVENVFNFMIFTCSSGGLAELSSLLEDSWPFESIKTEQGKKKGLKTQSLADVGIAKHARSKMQITGTRRGSDNISMFSEK